MQKKLKIINSLLLLLTVACSSFTIAVAQEATKEIRIKIEKDVNGEKHSIDKVFTDPNDPELKKLLEEHNMNIGEDDIDIEVDKDKEIDVDKSATLKLKLKGDDENQLEEFKDKIEKLAEDMDIDFSDIDIDIKKEDANQIFKLFGEDFEDLTKNLKGKSFKLDTMIDLEGQDLEMIMNDMKSRLKNLDLEGFDPDGQIYKFFDYDEDAANKAIMGVMIDDAEAGILITGLNEGFGAKNAGLKEGDLITAIDNKTMKTADEVVNYINSLRPGDLITVTYKRENATNTTKVELMENKTVKSNKLFGDAVLTKTSKPIMGAMIKDDGDKVIINGINDGFGAEKAGLQEGDEIISVDDKAIGSVEELTNYISEKKIGDIILVEYKRAGKKQKAPVELMKSGLDEAYPKYYNWIEKFDLNEGNNDKDLLNKNTRVMVMITDLEQEDKEKLNEISPNNKSISDDLALAGFEFFPNPSQGLFNLSFDVAESLDTEVNIYDIAGKIVYHKFIKNFMGKFNEAIDLQNNQSGSYILEIIQGNKRTNKKIVVK